MRFEWFLARRYLTRGRKHSFISVISLVSIIGIAIGVAALVVALSLINGFQKDIRDRILSSSAHVLVADRLGDGIADWRISAEQVRRASPQVIRVAPVVFGTVLVRGEGREIAGAVLRGMDLAATQEPWLRRPELGGLPRDGGVLLGRDLATRVNALAGDTCLVITPRPVLSPTGILPRFKRFPVAGVFRSGLYEFDNGTMITSLATAQTLFGLGDRVSYLQVYLKDLFAATEVAERLREQLPVRLSAITWKELNASLYSALSLEKTVLFFTLTLIVVVAALNIVAGLILLVIQKVRDIGILLSYGAPPGVIRRIFFLQGGVIGLIGTSAGLLVGILFCHLANRFELIRVPADIYQVGYVPFRVEPFDVLAIGAVSLLISLLATLIPSRRAAAINVVEAVKYE